MKETVILLNQNSQTRILGLSLLERLILYGKRAGLRKFWLYASDFNLALKAREDLLSDRRFSPEHLEIGLLKPENLGEFAAQTAGPYVLVLEGNLAVHPDFFVSLATAEPEPGKDLILVSKEERDGLNSGSVGPGVFLVSRKRMADLFPRLVELSNLPAARPGEISSPGSVDYLAIACPFLVRVDSQEAARLAEKLLLETGRKPVDGYITRVFFRPISLRVTRHLIKWGLTPNQISLFVLAVEITSVFLILQGRYRSLALGAFLYQLSSVIDCCDGENARLTCRISRFGTVFDLTADAFLFVTFFSALPIGLFRASSNPFWLYVGAFGLLSMVSFYLQMIWYAGRSGIGFNIVPIAREVEGSIKDRDFQTWADRIAARIAFIYRRDFFTTMAFLLVVLGGAGVLAVAVAFFAFLEAVYFGSWARRRLKKKDLSRLQPA